jgi:predicted nucleotidyltransferase
VKPSLALAAHRDDIRRVVAAHRACNPRVFGSVVRGNDTDDSDLDILIDPTPATSLFDIGAIRHELLQLLGVPVDVLTPKALPGTFRAAVIRNLQIIGEASHSFEVHFPAFAQAHPELP